MSLDFIERDEQGAHIKINVTPAVRAAAGNVVDAFGVFNSTRKFRDQMAFNSAVSNLRGAVHKDNPGLSLDAFKPYAPDGSKIERQRIPNDTRKLRKDMRLAVQDSLNALLKEIADNRGVEAPVLPSEIPERAQK